MTPRERIQTALRGETPDVLPVHESFWDGLINDWRDQGMPEMVSVEDFFGFDITHMSIDASPRFEQRILDRSDGMITFQDRTGCSLRKEEKRSSTIQFFDHLTQDRSFWEAEVRPRLFLSDDPREPARIDEASYFAHFDPYPTWEEAARKFQRLRATDRYMLFVVYGPWEANWRHRGMESLLMDLALEPDWVRAMADAHIRLVIDVLRRCLDTGMKPDGLFLVEDLGATRSLLFSVRNWREVLKPAMETLGTFLRENGIAFWMHSCGAVEALIDDLIACGVQVLNPLQVDAGMDIRRLYELYRGRLAFYGNISVRRMIEGGPGLLEELRTKVPLATRGGFVFHSDHSIPPQVSFERYSRMLSTAREIFEVSRK
jgi:uroporphyrinogen decarboxylase